jgi:hypothetical protein
MSMEPSIPTGENVQAQLSPTVDLAAEAPVAMEPPVAPDTASGVHLVQFALSVLGTILGLAVIAFSVADDLARGWLAVRIVPGAAICVLPFLVVWAGRAHSELKKETIRETAPGEAARRLLRQSVIFTIVFLTIGSLVGYAVGRAAAPRRR